MIAASRRNKIILEIMMVIVALIYIYPLFLVIINSFKTYGEIYNDPLGLPKVFRVENYIFVWKDIEYVLKVFNSIFVTATPLPFVIFFGSMAAYKLARTKTVLSKILFFVFISTMLIPLNVIMVPLIIVARTFGMINKLWSLVLVYIALTTPFAIFLYHGFVKNIKNDIEESAKIDGCGSFATYYKIVLPMLSPITTTIIILLVLYFWNDFFLPLLLISDEGIKTLPLVAYKYSGEFMKEWSKILPAVVLLSLPIFVFFFILQKYILEGIAQGAVKG